MSDSEKKLNKEIMNLLSEDQKIVFLRTMLFLSRLDSRVDDKEIAFIKKSAQRYKISDVKKIFENISQESLLAELSAIDNRRVALELLKELFLLSNADGQLSDEEIVFIMRAARMMNIEIEKTEQISQWVIDYLVWREEGRIIFEED